LMSHTLRPGRVGRGSVAISLLIGMSTATCGLGSVLFERGHTGRSGARDASARVSDPTRGALRI
jgi:hypothetical protein